MKQTFEFSINNFNELKIQMLNWAKQFNIFCLLDNTQYNFETPSFECLLAVGCKQKIELSNDSNLFQKLQNFNVAQKGNWIFGHVGYDVKNNIEELTSNNIDNIEFPDVCFFVPETVVKLTENTITIYDVEGDKIYNQIIACSTNIDVEKSTAISIQNRISKAAYIQAVENIQAHILSGNCYEVNFCQEFYANNVVINPIEIYQKLITISPNPFAALYKLNDKYCICASPERYIKKQGNTIFSQPIKGTASRNIENAVLDEQNKNDLLNSSKERSENVMVVDLVRNDLSKICKEGSVKVDELCGIYSFPQVHQMISKISGVFPKDKNWVDAIQATFPMGSMTGVPKKRVMQLIEQYESTKRSLFSGSIGYITPDGDFDFNVIIRSILYNASKQYLSFHTGGAITFHSKAEEEYNESLLKAQAMLMALNKDT